MRASNWPLGSHRDIVKVELGHGGQESIQARTDQWLTASDAQAFDAGGFDQVGHATSQGLRRQFVLCCHQALAVWHAVGAGIVTGSRQADAQVAKNACLDDRRS
ncbi:hypothetical protein PPS11_34963 [Pseudomonas putida S11]|nr:hypothetical protein PPS11_34963 [Pseudomonas putida S11]